jgi:hypothetical protein
LYGAVKVLHGAVKVLRGIAEMFFRAETFLLCVVGVLQYMVEALRLVGKARTFVVKALRRVVESQNRPA